MNPNLNGDPFFPAGSPSVEKIVQLVGGPFDGMTAKAPGVGSEVFVEGKRYARGDDGRFCFAEEQAAPGSKILEGRLSGDEVNAALARRLLYKLSQSGGFPGDGYRADKIDVTFERDSNSPGCEIGSAFVRVHVSPAAPRIIKPGE